VRGRGDDWTGLDWTAVKPTHDYTAGRGAGVAGLARAIRSGGDCEQRATGALGAHVLALMDGPRSAAVDGTSVDLDATVERPAPLASGVPG